MIDARCWASIAPATPPNRPGLGIASTVKNEPVGNLPVASETGLTRLLILSNALSGAPCRKYRTPSPPPAAAFLTAFARFAALVSRAVLAAAPAYGMVAAMDKPAPNQSPRPTEMAAFATSGIQLTS